jgi:hypothetical protein
MEERQKWFLLKHDDESVFGPLDFEQLRQWALAAQLSPLDKVSTDGKTWTKAPMVPDLQMDYIVETGPDQHYGPTTVGALREFLTAGEITLDTVVTNCKDGSQRAVRDVTELDMPTAEEPIRTSIRENLQQRLRELEESLMDERRARQIAETRCERLQARLAEIAKAMSVE